MLQVAQPAVKIPEQGDSSGSRKYDQCIEAGFFGMQTRTWVVPRDVFTSSSSYFCRCLLRSAYPGFCNMPDRLPDLKA